MKNTTRIFSLLLALLLIFGAGQTAFAQSEVKFEDNQVIAFGPGSVWTDSDLFENFKNLMPGDLREEEVTIKNEVTECDYIKVYMRAVPHDATQNKMSEKVAAEESNVNEMNDFLAQLEMEVKNGEEKIYEASPDLPDGLDSSVLLGTLRQGEELKLDVQLKAPKELGNEYMDRVGEVDWVFVVEGFDDPVPPEDDEKMTVRKVWDDDGKIRPESITVELLRDGALYDKAVLQESNQWTHTWDKLSNKHEWTVREEVPEGYKAVIQKCGQLTTITNVQVEKSPEEEKPEPLDLKVVKKWDDRGKDRPTQIKVTLYNGEKAVETVLLGDWNNWSYQWKQLDGKGKWQVVETEIPKGYTPKYSAKDGVVTITNTKTLIQTGQLNWPVPVLGGLGTLFVIYGLLLTRKRKREDA